LHVHEYQGQALLKKYGINVPVGAAAGTAEEAFTIAKDPTAGHKGFFVS
jgi:succinyl-CoA synthetase beta subunit